MLLTLKVTCDYVTLAKIIAATNGADVEAIGIEGDGDTQNIKAITSTLGYMTHGVPEAGNSPKAASPATETASTPTPAPTAPSAPTPAAPTAPAPSPQTSTDSDEEGDDTDGLGTDSDGLPWDERIHSSSKKKGKDGTWNKRRGGPDGEERAAIEAELRASLTGGDEQPATPEAPAAPQAPTAPPPPPMPAPAAPEAPAAPSAPPPPVPAAPTAPNVPPMPAVDTSAPAAPAAQPEQPAAPAAPVAAPTDMDFPTFMGHIGPKLGEGDDKIGAAYLAEACQAVGINTITDLAPKPEYIAPLIARLQADGKW